MAGLMGIEGPVRFLVYVRNGFLVGKVAKVGGLLRVEVPIPCLVMYALGVFVGTVA